MRTEDKHANGTFLKSAQQDMCSLTSVFHCGGLIMSSKLGMLNTVKELYHKGENIMQYLNNKDRSVVNAVSDIMISYDVQAGSYIADYKNRKSMRDPVYAEIVNVLNRLNVRGVQYVLEAGVGEAVALGHILQNLTQKPELSYAFDLSWSRIKYGQDYLNKLDVGNVQMFTGDLFQAPIRDNSIDIVYTIHAVEPNGGREKEALQELYRMARQYVVLFEPAYELACKEAKKRMHSHGYITKLYETAIELGYTVEEYRLLGPSLNELNPTGVMIIRKDVGDSDIASVMAPLCCPITRVPLLELEGLYYAESSMLSYPILHGVPCLLPHQAVVTTHLNEFLT